VEELSDEMIMLRVKKGALAELSELFDRYHVKMFNFFMKLTFDRAASEDLTQNLFYRLIRYRNTYDGKDNSFKPWIYQMARNLHSDYYRQQKKNNEVFRRPETGHENIPPETGHFEEDDYKRLEWALQRLEPDQREIIVMSRYQGLKYEEISKIRNISVPAIKVQVHRTMKELRKIYFNHKAI
jgi:RNA polymerase sigma-70 factor (ECF subfamily)